MTDANAITWWIAALTVLVGVQSVALAVIAVKAVALSRRAESTLTAVDERLAPLAAEARDLLGDLHALRQAVQRAERGLSAAIDHVAATADRVTSALTRRLWPVVGTVAAGRAILRTLSARRHSSRRLREDQIAVARFVDEGGPSDDSR